MKGCVEERIVAFAQPSVATAWEFWKYSGSGDSPQRIQWNFLFWGQLY